MSSDEFEWTQTYSGSGKLKWQEHPGRWIDPDWSNPSTLRCHACAFTILLDRSIRFDEMCEHFNPAPGYPYPFNEYFMIKPGETL